MSEGEARVVLAVVTYGHQAVLPATLDALTALDYPAARREIVVVDNGDGACAAIAAGRGIRSITPGRNLGFAGGSNAAIDAVEADVVVLINPDLRPRPGFLNAVVAALAEAHVGAVGAKLLYADGRTIQHAGGRLEHPRLTAQHDGYGRPDDGNWDQARGVEFVTGAALAARREVWTRLGGLDTAFAPAYYEDVDFCLRLREHGLEVRYEPRAVAEHLESTVLRRGSSEYHRLYHRNRLRLLWKHVPDERLIRAWLPAELAYLRTTSDDGELEALMEVYLWWQTEFLANQANQEHGTQNTEHTAGNSKLKTQNSKLGSENLKPETWNLKLGGQLETRNSKLGSENLKPETWNLKHDWLLGQVQRKINPMPAPFRSRLPFVARLRELASRLVLAEYVRPLTQQQNDFNASAAELLAVLVERTERQRRSADAAIACQAMLLAKMLGDLE